MSLWLLVPAALVVLYLFALVAFCWLQRGRDALNEALRSEQRPESDAVLSAMARANPAYRFRRHSNDEQVVPRQPARPVLHDPR